MTRKHNGMNQRGKRGYSLSHRTLWTVVISCLFLGVVAIIIGLQFYYTALNDRYIQHASDISVFAHQSATRGSADSVGLAEQVMGIYHTLNSDQRKKVGTEEYKTFFSEVNVGKGSAYDILIHMLATFIKAGEVDDVYLAMYDRNTNALVYMVDPQEENRFYTGEWESVDADEVEKFLTWDGKGLLYHNANTKKYGPICTSGTPILNEQGDVCGFILVDVTTEHIMDDLIDFAVRISLALLAVTALIAWLLERFIRRNIVKPLNALAGAASSYVQDKKDGSSAADHFSALNIHGGTEMENLCLTMSDMEKDISEHEETIKKDAAEKERINTELDLARNIQASALPSSFPAFPERQEIDLFASMTPAKEVGGDFYDFFFFDSDHMALVIADVSGKGIPAALFMMTIKTLIKNQLQSGCDPAAALDNVNRQISERNTLMMFVTVWLAVLEISTGKGLACNAGHEHPVLQRADEKYELQVYPHNMLVGGLKKARYQNREFELRPGDCIFVYTDGIPEAKNTMGEMFGEERLTKALNQYPNVEPEELIRHVHDAVNHFAGNAEQFDDITMLCFRYYGTQNQKQRPR